MLCQHGYLQARTEWPVQGRTRTTSLRQRRRRSYSSLTTLTGLAMPLSMLNKVSICIRTRLYNVYITYRQNAWRWNDISCSDKCGKLLNVKHCKCGQPAINKTFCLLIGPNDIIVMMLRKFPPFVRHNAISNGPTNGLSINYCMPSLTWCDVAFLCWCVGVKWNPCSC